MKHVKARKALGIVLLFVFAQALVIAPSDTVQGATLSYTFAVGADAHTGDPTSNPNGERQEILADSVVANGAERYLDLGDHINENTDHALYPNIKTAFDDMGIPYHLVCGNHDSPTQFLSTFGYSSLHYNVTYGDMVWIMLHSTSWTADINATQMDYLSDALTYYSDKLAFICMHVSHQILAYPGAERDSTDFRAIVEAHADHIGGIFSGHAHNYNTMTYTVNSVRYSYAGTYGSDYSMFTTSPYPYRYLLVEVYDDWSIEIKAVCPDDNSEVHGSSASYTPSTGLSVVWSASGAEPRLASDAGNWDNGVPTEGSVVIFNATSVLNATWDIDVNCSLYAMTSWTGSINQSVTTTFNDFVLLGGTYTPDADNRTVIWGNGVTYGTRIPSSLLRVEFAGDHKKWSFSHNVPAHKEVIVSGDILLVSNQYVSTTGIGMNVTGTLNITSGTRTTIYPYADCVLSGHITGLGTFKLDGLSYGTGYLPEFGTVDCQYFLLQSESSRTFRLSGDLTLGGRLEVNKSNAGGMNTLDLCNYTLSAGGILVGSYVTLKATDSTVICAGDFDTANGTFQANTSSVILDGPDSYAKLATGQQFHNLTIGASEVRLNTDTAQDVDFEGNSHFMRFEPTLGFVNVTFHSNSALSWSWNLTTDDVAETTVFTLTGLQSGIYWNIYRDQEVVTYNLLATGVVFTVIGGGEFIISETPSDDTALPDDPGTTEESPATSEPAETSLSYTSIGFIAVACASTMIILLLFSRRTKGPSRKTRS